MTTLLSLLFLTLVGASQPLSAQDIGSLEWHALTQNYEKDSKETIAAREQVKREAEEAERARLGAHLAEQGFTAGALLEVDWENFNRGDVEDLFDYGEYKLVVSLCSDEECDASATVAESQIIEGEASPILGLVERLSITQMAAVAAMRKEGMQAAPYVRIALVETKNVFGDQTLAHLIEPLAALAAGELRRWLGDHGNVIITPRFP